MIAVLAVVLLCLAALGGGAIVLRLSSLLDKLRPAEALSWSAVLGMGLIGWAAFLLPAIGGFNRGGFLGLALVLAAGVPLLRHPARLALGWRPDWRLAALALVPAAVGIATALTPMADADTLAYHYALPWQALAAGGPVFIPRAVDGAVPQLIQMTFAAAMALGGGELAANLWALATSWMLAALAYATLRRWLPSSWSLAGALCLLTIPALVYGGVSGQVEIRLASLTLVLAMAAALALKDGDWRWALVAGLAGGFLAGGKYTALLPVAMAGGVLLAAGRKRPALALAFAFAGLAAGWEWYVWIWRHSGDPLFPMLWGLVPYRPGFPWNDAQQAAFREFSSSEIALARSWWTVLDYPVIATFSPLPQFEGGRTGFGPLGFVLLPFALIGAWRQRGRLAASPLAVPAVIAVASYVLWMWLGPSQRVRHLLPLVPLALIPLAVAASRSGPWRRPLAAGIAAVLAIQCAGMVVYGMKSFRHLASGESADAFLERNVLGWPLLRWANATLGPGERLLLPANNRMLDYRLTIPHLVTHARFSAEIEVRDDATAARLWRQMKAAGITLAAVELPAWTPFAQLIERGCLTPVREFSYPEWQSRTLPGLGAITRREAVYRLAPDCGINGN